MEHSSDYIIFADESGDHGLATMNRDYPIFVLSCCVFEKSAYVERVCPALQKFKLRWWLHDAVILHSSQIKRHEPPFSFLASVATREKFMEDLAAVLRAIPFTLFATAIDKVQLKEQHACSINPYDLALARCVEQMFEFLRTRGQADQQTSILIEKRGKSEDKQLRAAFNRICEDPSLPGASAALSIELVDKKANLPGLQIADLVSTPIGRHLLKPHVRNRAFDAIRQKLWVGPQDLDEMCGLITLP